MFEHLLHQKRELLCPLLVSNPLENVLMGSLINCLRRGELSHRVERRGWTNCSVKRLLDSGLTHLFQTGASGWVWWNHLCYKNAKFCVLCEDRCSGYTD